MKAIHCYIQVGDQPLCFHMGTRAFALKEEELGKAFSCDYSSKKQAQEALRLLRHQFAVPLKVIEGRCPRGPKA